MAVTTRLELATPGVTNRCSDQTELSHLDSGRGGRRGVYFLRRAARVLVLPPRGRRLA
jgi:hypothetical protein